MSVSEETRRKMSESAKRRERYWHLYQIRRLQAEQQQVDRWLFQCAVAYMVMLRRSRRGNIYYNRSPEFERAHHMILVIDRFMRRARERYGNDN